MKALRVLLSLAVVFGLVIAVEAADKAAKKKAGVQGVVEKVDSEGKALTIKTATKKDPNAAAQTVTFSDATKVTIKTADGDKEGKLSDVTAGKRVQIVTETKDGKTVATSVTIVEAKKKK